MIQKPNIDMNSVGGYKTSTFNNSNNNSFINNSNNFNVNVNNYDNIEDIDYSDESFQDFSKTNEYSSETVKGLNTDEILAEKIKWNKIRIEKERKEIAQTTIYDREAIGSTRTGYIANYLEDLNLTDHEYKLLLEYLKGKKISDIFDESGKFKTIECNNIEILDKVYNIPNASKINGPTDTFNFFDTINKKIEDKLKDKKLTIDETCKDYIIEEIIVDDSGYNAVVFKDDMGNYVISSSPTNANSPEDLNAILYSMVEYVYGDATLAEYLPAAVMDKAGKKIGGTSKDIYESQINSCYDLIKKYAKLADKGGTKLNISGYSLGGGITLTAYGLFQKNEQELLDNVANVSVYNAFLQYMDQKFSEDRYKGCFDAIKNDDKVRIFSAEGDIVSTFNDYIPKLADKIDFIPSPEITERLETIDLGTEKITISASIILDLTNILTNYETNEERLEQITLLAIKTGADYEKLKKLIANPDIIIENVKENISIYYKIIIQGEGNHGYKYDNNIFDSTGKLIDDGNYININELFSVITGREYTGSKESPDMDFILQNSAEGILGLPPEIIFDYFFNEKTLGLDDFAFILDDINVKEDLDINGIDISDLKIAPIIELLYNPSNYSPEIFVDTVATSIAEWFCLDKTREMLKENINNNIFGYVIDNLKNKEDIEKLMGCIATILKDEKNYQLTYEMMFSILNGNKQTGMKILMDDLIKPNLDYILKENIGLVLDAAYPLLLNKFPDKDIKILWLIDTGISLRDIFNPILRFIVDDLKDDLPSEIDKGFASDIYSLLTSSDKIDLDKIDKIIAKLATKHGIKNTLEFGQKTYDIVINGDISKIFEAPNFDSVSVAIGIYWLYRVKEKGAEKITGTIGGLLGVPSIGFNSTTNAIAEAAKKKSGE